MPPWHGIDWRESSFKAYPLGSQSEASGSRKKLNSERGVEKVNAEDEGNPLTGQPVT